MSKTRLLLVRLLFVLAAALIAVDVKAAELVQEWSSVRALGMGNAYTAVVADSDSLFYNPAGLAKVKGIGVTIADPRVGANGLQSYNDYQSYEQNGLNSTFLEGLYGHQDWIGGGGKTAIVLPGFGFAAFASSEGSAQLQNPAYPTLNSSFFFDYGVTAGFGLDVVPGLLSVGASLKQVNRTGNDFSIGASSLAQLNSTQLEAELKNRGAGLGLDVGAQLTFPTPLRPVLSFAILDAGSTSFSFQEGLAAPPPIAQDMVIGAALHFSVPGLQITPAIDYRYADRSDIQVGEKISAGVEVQLLMLSFRAGINQGYLTAGAGLDIGLVRFDAATYGVELGEYAGQLQDRRYMAQATMELDFDPFSLFSSRPGAAAYDPDLKQRR